MDSLSVVAISQADIPAHSPSTPSYDAGAHSDSAQPGAAESLHGECQPCSPYQGVRVHPDSEFCGTVVVREYQPCSPCPGVRVHSDSADCDEESVQNYRPTSPVANRPMANQPPVRQFDTAVLKTELGKRAIARIKAVDDVVQHGKRARMRRTTLRFDPEEDIEDEDEEDGVKEWIENEPQTLGGEYAQVSMQYRISEAWVTLHWLEKMASIAKIDLGAVDPEGVLDPSAQ